MKHTQALPFDWNNITTRQFVLFAAAILVLITIADVFPFTHGEVRFIGHGDQADMAIVARNIAEGRGAVVDTVWLLRDWGMSYHGISHPEDYWSIYLASFVSLFFSLFGATREMVLLSASLAKTLAAVICAVWVWRETDRDWLATTFVLLFVSLWPSMIDNVTGYSDMALTACAVASLSLFALAASTSRRYLYLGAGLVMGMGIGIKPSAWLFFGVPLFFLLVRPRTLLKNYNFPILIAGLLIGCSALIYHNYTNYRTLGIFAPPAYNLVHEAADIRYASGSHDAAFYSPEPVAAAVADNAKGAKYYLKSLTNWVKKGFFRGELVPPFILFFFLLYLWQRRQSLAPPFAATSAADLFAICAVLMVFAGAVLALVVHYESRYWNFLLPLMAVPAAIAMSKTVRPVLAIAVLFVIAYGVLTYATDKDEAIADPLYATVSKTIPGGKSVIVNNPLEFTFHTRIKSVMEPYTDKPSVILKLAQKFEVEYLVILRKNVRHPIYMDILNGKIGSEWLEPVVHNDDLYIAKFRFPSQGEAVAAPQVENSPNPNTH
jgi:4-amino-4-deoxy-L-arabinose transferase-like glycosyltransferase